MVAGNFPIPDDETIRRSKRIIDNVQKRYGNLEIDYAQGTILFKSHDNTVLLRITHLRGPMPHAGFIDIVALDALTSYTDLEDSDAERK